MRRLACVLGQLELSGGCRGRRVPGDTDPHLDQHRGLIPGVGGTQTLMGTAINVTAQGGPWTTGTTVVSLTSHSYPRVLSAMGFVHGPASGSSSSAAAAGGVVSLVTPISIYTDLGTVAALPAVGILTLEFVPEPGTLALLGAGLAALAAAGRRRPRPER